MRYYTTGQGIARGLDGDDIELLDVEYRDLGEALQQDPSLAILASAQSRKTVSLKELTLLAPVRRPGKVICMGINYQSHVDEIGHILKALNQELPTEPVFFTVPTTAVALRTRPPGQGHDQPNP